MCIKIDWKFKLLVCAAVSIFNAKKDNSSLKSWTFDRSPKNQNIGQNPGVKYWIMHLGGYKITIIDENIGSRELCI